jgi:uncharacterized protein with von Willebrand factor type A (vWA) domain
MYPFASLPSNLIAFGDFLRREHGFQITSGELRDAARALEVVTLSDERAVRNALRPILSRTAIDVSVFDPAFTAFFFPGPSGVRQQMAPARRRLGPGGAPPDVLPEVELRTGVPRRAEEEGAEGVAARVVPVVATEGRITAPLFARGSYSPLAAEAAGEVPELTPVDPAWRDAARALVHRLHLGLLRRWKPAARGRRFDLRRTLRASVQTGGEALVARWLRRQRRTPRFVLLIDGSRSMGAHAHTALQVAVALASVTMRIEVFTFSTALRRITDDVRRAAAGETRRLDHLHHAWAGGTSIGACLREFLHRFGKRMIGRDTVVIIVSDGLDIGEPRVLQGAMHDLHRRSASVVWLNPLLDAPGYEPTAIGMRTARPYITTFTSANDVAEFARLPRVLRARA